MKIAFITSSLVCGGSPKLISGDVGYTTVHMVTDVYENFLDTVNWPHEEERARLAELFGRAEDSAARAPHALPEAPTLTDRKTPPS